MLWQDYYKILKKSEQTKEVWPKISSFPKSSSWLAILSPLKHLFNIFLQKQIMFSLIQVGPSLHLPCYIFLNSSYQHYNFPQQSIHTFPWQILSSFPCSKACLPAFQQGSFPREKSTIHYTHQQTKIVRENLALHSSSPSTNNQAWLTCL